jgi:hypothetical protein
MREAITVWYGRMRDGITRRLRKLMCVFQPKHTSAQ